MRLSDHDRELLYESLAQHAAAGRLTVEELERRIEIVAVAQTREQAAPAMSDLPPLPAPAAQQAPAAQARPGQPRRGPRGHADADAPQADWHPTPERFRDPRSGRVMRVWVDAAGARHYVPDE